MANIIKVLLVAFGALAATKSTADQLLGTGSTTSATFYATLGVLTAAAAGVSAAFGFDGRAAQMTQLASEAWTALREADSRWRQEVAVAQAHEAGDAALRVIELQDLKLADIQSRAAKLGVNIPLDIHPLMAPSSDRIYPA